MKQNKILSLVGLATKAGKTASGEFSTEKSVKEGKACLVIVSVESSENTKKKFTNMCTFYKVPMYLYGTKDELGAAMGKEFQRFPGGEGQRPCSSDPEHLDELGA